MELHLKKAVAINYKPELPAPIVVAKGRGVLANRIIREAQNNGIPVIEDDDLTKLLYMIDVGNYIPPELYKAVAEVLIFIHQLEKEV